MRFTGQPRLARHLWVGLVLGGLAGCDQVQPVAPHEEPITDPTQLYTALRFDHSAVTMSTAAPYDTVRLTAVPRDGLGNPMAGLPAPTYRAVDTTKVRVTAGGLVTAVSATSQTTVIATLTVGPVSRADTAMIKVTSLTDPPVLGSLETDPLPPDSAIRAQVVNSGTRMQALDPDITDVLSPAVFLFSGARSNISLKLTPRALDTAGVTISSSTVLFDYQVLDPEIAKLGSLTSSSIDVAPRRPGQARVVTRTLIYGVARADTLLFTVTLPILQSILVSHGVTGTPTLEWSEVRIAPGGMVGWDNFLGDSLDIVFDEPTGAVLPPANVCAVLNQFIAFGFATPESACGDTGDFLLSPVARDTAGAYLPPLSVRILKFPVPGVYPYHSVRTGLSGRIVVTAEPE